LQEGEDMNGRRIKILGVMMIIFCTSFSFALADISTIKGTIQSIDMKGASFKLQTDDKKVMEYKADSVLLEDLKPGDIVFVTIDEKEIVAISLDKKDAD
jgi:hypothetical protein